MTRCNDFIKPETATQDFPSSNFTLSGMNHAVSAASGGKILAGIAGIRAMPVLLTLYTAVGRRAAETGRKNRLRRTVP
jgi:hypothetical protein